MVEEKLSILIFMVSKMLLLAASFLAILSLITRINSLKDGCLEKLPGYLPW
jgi:hypothetical protein